MKLFLASLGLTPKLMPHLAGLFDNSKPIRALVIPNASDNRDEAKQQQLLEFNKILSEHGISYQVVDIRDYLHDPAAFVALLKDVQFIWVPGGNTFLLLRYFLQLGMKDILLDFLARGGVYGGGSAGAIVLNKSMQYFALGDDPLDTNLKDAPGLGIIDFTFVPHQDSSDVFRDIAERLKVLPHAGKLYALDDNEAVIVDGDSVQIVQ